MHVLPPSVVYWVTGSVERVEIIDNYDALSKANDKAVVKFTIPMLCGDNTQAPVSELHLYFNDNIEPNLLLGACDFVERDAISIGFMPNGEIYDVICPVDLEMKSLEDLKAKRKAMASEYESMRKENSKGGGSSPGLDSKAE